MANVAQSSICTPPTEPSSTTTHSDMRPQSQAAPHVRYHEPTVRARVATSKTTRVPAMCHCQRRATSVRPTLTLPSEARCGQNTAGMGSRNPPRPALRSPRASAGRSSRRRPVSCSCSLRPAVSSVATRDRQPCGLAKADVSRTSSKVYMWHACMYMHCAAEVCSLFRSVAMSPPRKVRTAEFDFRCLSIIDDRRLPHRAPCGRCR